MFKSTRVRVRARWLFWFDTLILLFAVKQEFDAVTAAQLTELAGQP